MSAESTTAVGVGSRPDRGEAADLATHSEPSEAALAAAAAAAASAITSSATTSVGALDAIRGGASPQGASITTTAAATPRPPRGRRRAAHNHNGIDAPQVCADFEYCSLDELDLR